MSRSVGSYQILPISSKPLNGVLHKSIGKTWEFYVGDDKNYHVYGVNKNELNKLPNYPVTRGVCREGIEVTLEYSEHQCTAAFHGFTEEHRGGRHIFIGSARTLKGPEFMQVYREFLWESFRVNVEVNTNPILVKLDFQAGNVVYVYPMMKKSTYLTKPIFHQATCKANLKLMPSLV